MSKLISTTPLRDLFDRLFGDVVKDDEEGSDALFDVFLCGANTYMAMIAMTKDFAEEVEAAKACKAEIDAHLKNKRRKEAEQN